MLSMVLMFIALTCVVFLALTQVKHLTYSKFSTAAKFVGILSVSAIIVLVFALVIVQLF
jgi:hypothetical protein